MELIVICAIVYGIYRYLKRTRIERRAQKFEKVREQIRARGKDKRDALLAKSQKASMVELGSIVKKQLDKYKMEIPPRLFQDAKSSIDAYVKEMQFDKLYALYNLLVATNEKRVLEDLNRFFQ